MASHAYSLLGPVAERLTDRTAARAAPRAVPAQGTLDAELRAQRLRLVRWYAIGVTVFGSVWCAVFAAYTLRGSGFDWLAAIVTVHAGILGVGGQVALRQCRQGHLRKATYSNVSALVLAASANLIFIANAEGAAFMTYSVAVCVAALVIEGREWFYLAGVLCLSALAAAVLHSFPPFDPLVLPPAMRIGSLLVAATAGFAFPMGMFRLSGANLAASREEAWALARNAAAANALASERAAQLEARTEQLQAKNAELNDFLYVVSHDLRAPLINLEGFSRTLQENLGRVRELVEGRGNGTPPGWSELTEEMAEALDFILRSVDKMDFLVRGLLELSRIDSRAAAVQPVDLGRVVDDVLGTLHYTISERGVAVQVDPLPVIAGDPLRLSQVFGNLIDNAVKYAKPDGAARIRIGCEDRSGGRCFFVCDNGVGIRPADHAKIFRLFTRLGAPSVPGDGIGLTAVKKIVEQHGGKIWVESALDQGSTFWFTLPGGSIGEEGGG